MQESRRIFLVTTAEVASLHFASMRLRQLATFGLKDHVSLVLNRHRDRCANPLSVKQVAEAVGLPVSFTFPNSYESIQRGVLDGDPVPHDAALVKAVQELTHFMLPNPDEAPRKAHAGHRFLELFHVSREGDAVWRA